MINSKGRRKKMKWSIYFSYFMQINRFLFVVLWSSKISCFKRFTFVIFFLLAQSVKYAIFMFLHHFCFLLQISLLWSFHFQILFDQNTFYFFFASAILITIQLVFIFSMCFFLSFLSFCLNFVLPFSVYFRINQMNRDCLRWLILDKVLHFQICGWHFSLFFLFLEVRTKFVAFNHHCSFF